MQRSFRLFSSRLVFQFPANEPYAYNDNVAACKRKFKNWFELIWSNEWILDSLRGGRAWVDSWVVDSYTREIQIQNRHFISFDEARWCFGSRREIETFWLQTNLSHSNFVQVNYTNTHFLGLSKIKDWTVKFTIILSYDLAKLYDHSKYTIVLTYTSL